MARCPVARWAEDANSILGEAWSATGRCRLGGSLGCGEPVSGLRHVAMLTVMVVMGCFGRDAAAVRLCLDIGDEVAGVVLGKAWATYDWATRPLHPEALAYAIDDVVYLPGLAETLKAAVTAADIEDEVDQANRVVAASGWNGGFDPAGMWRIRDINALGSDGLRVLARLYAWRDKAAQAENLPAGRMINNEVLALLARHPPHSPADLRKSRLKGYIVDRYGPALLEAIALAKDDPVPQRRETLRMSPESQAREQRLKVWRREEAERRTRAEGRTVPLQLVLPARALEHLTLHGATDLAAVPQLGTRRSARYGDVLLGLCG